MTTLRDKVIKLGKQNPELRKYLGPILQEHDQKVASSTKDDLLDAIYDVPNWNRIDILSSFVQQIKRGRPMSPKQLAVINRYTGKDFTSFDVSSPVEVDWKRKGTSEGYPLYILQSKEILAIFQTKGEKVKVKKPYRNPPRTWEEWKEQHSEKYNDNEFFADGWTPWVQKEYETFEFVKKNGFTWGEETVFRAHLNIVLIKQGKHIEGFLPEALAKKTLAAQFEYFNALISDFQQNHVRPKWMKTY